MFEVDIIKEKGTLKLSICDFLPIALTFRLAQLRISASVISLPRVRDLRLLRSWSIWNLINCHKRPERDKTFISIFIFLHQSCKETETWDLGVMITKNELLIPLNYVISSYIYE